MSNMKKIIILLIIFSITNSVLAQNSTKKYIDIESTTIIEGLMYNMEKDINSYSDLLSYYHNDTLFFLRADFATPETLRMYSFAVKTKTYSYQDFDVTKLINNFDGRACNIDFFAINENYLVIPSHKGEINTQFLCIFKRVGKEFIYDFEIPLGNNRFSKDIRFLPNGKLLGLKNYIFYREKPEESSSLSILNLETKEVEKTINLEFLLPLYTLRGGYNILSVNYNSILFSQRGDYEIAEYDFDLNPLGIIENKEIKWDRMPQDASDSVLNTTTYAGERFPYINNNFDRYSCVHNIYSSNDKLFVFYSKKGNHNKIYYDIWKKQNGEWTIFKKDISDNTKSIRKVYKQTITKIEFGRNVHFLGDKFLRLGIILPDFGAYPNLIYMMKAQKYISNNDIPYGVQLINFKGL